MKNKIVDLFLIDEDEYEFGPTADKVIKGLAVAMSILLAATVAAVYIITH